jgi:3-oxoacyl-(acyl-carrier-protein) synthase
MTSCLGHGLAGTVTALRDGKGGLMPCTFDTVDLPTFTGEVAQVDSVQLPAKLARFDCRNNRLAMLGLEQDGFVAAAKAITEKYGAHRVAVFIGTSTSGILQTELAYRRLDSLTGFSIRLNAQYLFSRPLHARIPGACRARSRSVVGLLIKRQGFRFSPSHAGGRVD